MKLHKMLFDQETEDRPIGGKFTIKQFLYLTALGMFIYAVFIVNKDFTVVAIVLKCIGTFLVGAITLVLTFIKIDTYYVDQYLIKLIKYKLSKKVYVYKKY